MGVDQGLEGGKSMDWVWVDPWVTHAQPYSRCSSVLLNLVPVSMALEVVEALTNCANGLIPLVKRLR